MNKDGSQEQPTVQALWNDSYPLWKFIWESFFLSICLLAWYKLVQETIKLHIGMIPIILGFGFSLLLVDFVSGLIHWACDTWGRFETPIFGPTMIRSFRMHHVDPQDITRHGFIETNAASSYMSPPFLALSFYTNNGSFGSQTLNWTILFSVVLGILTNEIHKWAHMVYKKPNFIVQFLQKHGLIISYEKHRIHHQGEFNSGYCIINGWMNPFLEKINFWRRLESFITNVTGAIPRADDKFWRDCKQS